MDAKQDKLSREKPTQSFSKIWNSMKSMKFAIVVLLILAFTSIFNLFANEFLPSINGDISQAYKVYKATYGDFRASLLMFFQMSSPYRSWWYTLLLGTLTLSLMICVIDRSPNVFKRVFKPKFINDPKRKNQ